MLSDPRRLAVAFAGLTSFINLYATQPLLPQFARDFGASEGAVSMTVSAITFAVALMAPFVGVVADVLGRKRIIAGAMALLVAPTVLCALSHSLPELVFWRFVQGLLLPPIFAVTVAYIGDEFPGEEVAGVTGVYVAASAVGGFLGRLLSGLVADHWGWRSAFYLLTAVTAVSALFVAAALPRERRFVRAEGLAHSARLMLGHFLNPPIVATFAVGFAVLFSFVATFTYVNFYLGAPPFELSSSALGAIFMIYLVAVVVTPRTARWIRVIGRRRLVMAAVGIACLGLLLTLVPWLPAIILGLGLAATGGFISQTSATGLLAQRTTAARSSAVGLYVSFYYVGGGVGAQVPALFWARAGWPGCVALVILTLCGMALLVLRFWHGERPGAG
jgi:predicted MFS family arabinose efflux permease